MGNKILVVDDNPAALRLLKHTLTKEGHEVLTAANGIEGLQMALQEVPDLTILDVMLPGMDGFEVCHRLRSEATPAFLTGEMVSKLAVATLVQKGIKYPVELPASGVKFSPDLPVPQYAVNIGLALREMPASKWNKAAPVHSCPVKINVLPAEYRH